MHEKQVAARYFMLSFALGFLVFAVSGMFAVLLVPPQIRGIPAREKASGTYLPSNEDAKNVLLAVDCGVGEETFILLRLDPVRGQIPVTVLPAGTLIGTTGHLATISSLYDYAGVARVSAQLSSGLQITVDRYVKINESGVVKLADLLGGVRYTLPEPVQLSQGATQSTLPAGVHQLSGSLFFSLLTYNGYHGGDNAKAEMVGDLVSALINEHHGLILTNEADSIFEKFVNMVETDISVLDFQKHKNAMCFMAKLLGDPAFTVKMTGQSDKTFQAYTLSEITCAQLSEIYRPPADQA